MSKRSPPEEKDRDEDYVSGAESVSRFKKLAKKVVSVSREEVEAEDKRERKTKEKGD